jgi:hypothetical protein
MEEQEQTNPESQIAEDKSIIANLPPINKGLAITEEDKEAFFKSVLSDQPYMEKIDLFGGKMSILLKTMSVEENNDIVAQIENDKNNNLAENNDAYFITISTYRLALCLVEIDGQVYQDIDKNSFKRTDDGITYVGARAQAMLGWPTFKLSAFLGAFNDFEAKIVKLTSEVRTTNFWTASA